MSDRDLLLQLAHDLIGVHGLYQGREYTLIEVLDSGPNVVLEPVDKDNIVQNTAQGEAKRLAQNSYTLPFFSEVRQDIHPVLAEFLGEEICQVLREAIKKGAD